MRAAILIEGSQLPAWIWSLFAEAGRRHELIVMSVPVTRRAPWSESSRGFGARLFRIDARRTRTDVSVLHPSGSPPPLSLRILDTLPSSAELAALDAAILVNATGLPSEDLAARYPTLRFGVCAIQIDGRNAYEVRFPGLAGQVFGNSVQTVALTAWRGRTSVELGRAETRIHPTSPALNADSATRSARSLLEMALTKLERNPDRGLENLFPPSSGATPRPPSAGALARAAVSTAAQTLRNRARPIEQDQWSVGLLPRRVSGRDPNEYAGLRWLDPGPDMFLADPFLFEQDGRRLIFLEQFPYVSGKGRIAVVEWHRDGSLGDLRVVLETPHHLSFPLVFETDGRHFMLPEQAGRQCVVLYEATDFPWAWREARVLLPDFAGIDPVLFVRDGRWWLFVTSGEHLNQDNNLHLFSAQSLMDRFEPHPLNPVQLGLASSRMAGQVFERDGRLFRPSQCCSRRYGGSLAINEIMELGPDRYREVVVAEIGPIPESPYPLGLHTLNFGSDATVVDGLRRVRVPSRPKSVECRARLSVQSEAEHLVSA